LELVEPQVEPLEVPLQQRPPPHRPAQRSPEPHNEAPMLHGMQTFELHQRPDGQSVSLLQPHGWAMPAFLHRCPLLSLVQLVQVEPLEHCEAVVQASHEVPLQ
jgi:hypothetical protein